MPDLPQKSFIHHLLLGIHQVRCGTSLRPNLNDTTLCTSSIQDRLSLRNISGNRLLKIKIRPGIDRCNRRKSMPMIRSRNEDNLRLLLIEKLLVILKSGRTFFGDLPGRNQISGFAEHLGISITETHHIDWSGLNEPQ